MKSDQIYFFFFLFSRENPRSIEEDKRSIFFFFFSCPTLELDLEKIEENHASHRSKKLNQIKFDLLMSNSWTSFGREEERDMSNLWTRERERSFT